MRAANEPARAIVGRTLPERIRVLIVDAHDVLRAGVGALLGDTDDLEVVAECGDLEAAASIVGSHHIDVVVLDLTSRADEGMRALRELRHLAPLTSALVYTSQPEEDCLLPAFAAGAAGYLTKSTSGTELLDAVRTVATGEVFVTASGARVLAADMRHRATDLPDEDTRLARLTGREREVLRLVAEGHSAPAIGRALLISSKTVDTYKQRINEKLQLAGRPAYVRFAMRVGLLSAAEPDTRGLHPTH